MIDAAEPRTLRVAVVGAYGRMGSAVVEALVTAPDLDLAAAVTARPEAHVAPHEVPPGELNEDLQLDVVVDFTTPAATAAVASRAVSLGAALVVGTTGLGEAERHALERSSRSIAVVAAPNMSVGVNLLYELVRIASRALPDADVELVEMHHGGKRDAPSGTALRIVDVVDSVRGSLTRRFGRSGTSEGRSRSEIGIHALRGGDVAGEHTVIFAAEGERVELAHRASGRRAFALGTLRAVRFVASAPPALYDMRDVIAADVGRSGEER